MPELEFGYPTRDAIVDACAEAAHEAWYDEKVRRLKALDLPLTWPAENGEEQIAHWDDLTEPIRDFDRIVVGAIVDTLEERGYITLDPEEDLTP